MKISTLPPLCLMFYYTMRFICNPKKYSSPLLGMALKDPKARPTMTFYALSLRAPPKRFILHIHGTVLGYLFSLLKPPIIKNLFTVQHFVQHPATWTIPWPLLITNYKIGRYYITLLCIVSHLHIACSGLLQIFSTNLINPGDLFLPNPRLYERENW